MRQRLVCRRLAEVCMFLVVAGLGYGCQSHPPIVVNLLYATPEEAAVIAAERTQGVVVHLAPVADERSNQKTLGRTTVEVLPGSDLLTWVQDGMLTLRDQGFTLVLSGSDPPPPGYRIVATVTRVYVRSVTASLHSSVVLSVEYYRGGVLQGTRLHHGDGVVEDPSPFEGTYRFNEGKVLQVLNMALAEAVGQVAATIIELEGK